MTLRRLLLALPFLCSWCDPSLAFLHDMAEMTVTGTPGTGTITLNAAVSGYQTFAASGVIDGEIVSYSIRDVGGTWEVGRGTYTASGTTLTRGALYSSNSNSAISATSSAVVWIAVLAEDHGDLATVVLTSNNYNVAQDDCGKVLLLPTGTTPTVTLPNINLPTLAKCVIGFVQTTAVQYTIQAASGGTVTNKSSFTKTAGQYAIVTAVLVTPSVSAAVWYWTGDGA